MLTPENKIRIAVFVSGGGTNLQALIDAQKAGIIRSGEIVHVISDKADAYALERAHNNGIATTVVDRKKYPDRESFEKKLIETLRTEKIDLIVLAGFMRILGVDIIREYENRMINVHPSLIPSFCGKGFYGLKVHEAALEYGVKVTGATVHYVNEIPDGGKIILQKAVAIKKDDTPESLQVRVMKRAEWIILPKATELVCRELLKGAKK